MTGVKKIEKIEKNFGTIVKKIENQENFMASEKKSVYCLVKIWNNGSIHFFMDRYHYYMELTKFYGRFHY